MTESSGRDRIGRTRRDRKVAIGIEANGKERPEANGAEGTREDRIRPDWPDRHRAVRRELNGEEACGAAGLDSTGADWTVLELIGLAGLEAKR